jgi:hypothetical protein
MPIGDGCLTDRLSNRLHRNWRRPSAKFFGDQHVHHGPQFTVPANRPHRPVSAPPKRSPPAETGQPVRTPYRFQTGCERTHAPSYAFQGSSSLKGFMAKMRTGISACHHPCHRPTNAFPAGPPMVCGPPRRLRGAIFRIVSLGVRSATGEPQVPNVMPIGYSKDRQGSHSRDQCAANGGRWQPCPCQSFAVRSGCALKCAGQSAGRWA